MKYIVKHNIPNLDYKNEVNFPESHKDDALFRFHQIERKCLKSGYSVKSFVRESDFKPLRATLKVEVDSFTYYAELYAQ